MVQVVIANVVMRALMVGVILILFWRHTCVYRREHVSRLALPTRQYGVPIPVDRE